MNKSLGRVIVGVAGILAGTVANGVPITVQASGYINYSERPQYFPLLEQFTLTYTYESSAVDFVPDNPKRGDYRTAGMWAQMVIGTYSVSGTGGAFIVDDSAFDPTDRYAYYLSQCPLTIGSCGSLVGPSIEGMLPTLLEMELWDSSGTAFSSDQLPQDAPSVDSFALAPSVNAEGNRHIKLNLGGNGASASVRGVVTSISAVPIPPAVWLFGSALGLMGVMRRKISS